MTVSRQHLVARVGAFAIGFLGFGASCSASAIYSWGANTDVEVSGTPTGQLCVGAFTPDHSPTPITSILPTAGTVKITGGEAFVVVLHIIGATHSISVCGDNRYGELGIGSTTSITSPQSPTLSGSPVDIAAGRDHLLVAMADGSVWASGRNDEGELGNGTTTNSSVFVHVKTGTKAFLSGVVGVAAAGGTSFALRSDGTVWAWGSGALGLHGNGGLLNSVYAQQVTGGLTGKTATKIAAGFYDAYAITNTGDLYGWGFNGNGELGDGSTTQRNLPVLVKSSVSQVAGGMAFALALGTDGNIYATGINTYGQFGNGSTTPSLTWVLTLGPPSGASWVQIAAGHYHSVGRDSNSTIWDWGRNSSGQLGDGNIFDSHIPVIAIYSTPLMGAGADSTYSYFP